MNELWANILASVKIYPRAYICVGLSIVLGLLIYVRGGMIPQLKDTNEKAALELDIVLRNQSQGNELAEELKELKRLTAGMDSRLMIAVEKAANTQFFYDIETKSRASVNELRQTTLTQGDGSIRAKLEQFSAVGFDLSVSGRVGYVMSFLKRLESGKYFVRFNNVIIKGNPVLGVDGVDVILKLEVLAQNKK